MKIIVDCYGGDYSPNAHVQGAVAALNEIKDLEIVLVGKSDEIGAELEKYDFDENRVEVLNASDVISCDDKPTQAIREKKNSSLVVAFDLLKNDDECAAMVSTGSTGAVLAGAIMKIGRIRGVSRPALAPLLPSIQGNRVMLIDSGANADCKPVNLMHFAVMGSCYYSKVLGVAEPKVALLSNGTENEKGNQLTKDAFELIKNAEGVNFVGNCEARDILTGKYDVIVADGFSGNVAIKASEGAINLCLKSIKKEIKSSFIAKIGALFMKKVFSNVKNSLDYNKFGGAVVLGASKTVIKAHGVSNATAVAASVKQAYFMEKQRVNEVIAEGVSHLKCDEEV